MICLKCKSENQRGRFCGHCGEQIKTPCRECGEWEPIGRPMCLKKVKEAKEKLKKYFSGAFLGAHVVLGTLFFGICLIITSICFVDIGAVIRERTILFWSGVGGVVLLTITGWFISVRWERKRIKKAKERFFAECPNDKDILEKSGELEKIVELYIKK